MRALTTLVPGDPCAATGGYIYDRRIVAELSALGVNVAGLRLHDSFPRPTRAALAHADQVLAGIDDEAWVMVDGLALGAMPGVAAAHAHRLRLLGLVHHPLALESGLDAMVACELREQERRALAVVRGVIVTSASTRRTLEQDYDVDPRRVWVVEPGTDPAPLGTPEGPEIAMLCVASLTPRKAHAVLFQALSGLRHLPWSLCCAGSAARAPDTARALRAQVQALRLTTRIHFLGELDAQHLDRCYARAHVVILASRHEGYGMVVSEALARGIPVIATRAGALADTLPEPAGLLVPVDDEAALALALERFLTEPALRARLARGARSARETLRDWPAAGREFAAVLARMGWP